VRSLSPEEEALWAKVAATIKPLSRDAKDFRNPGMKAVRQAVAPAAARAPSAPALPPPPSPKPAPGLASQQLDGGWDRRLGRGKMEPDRIIDLHGHSLDSAWHTIDRGLERSIASGDRLVLLITGHARKGDPPLERGKIRAVVHDWLAASRHASQIAAIRGAHPRHGGGGSLYIVLRRR
jgi:DNA-nicking Smr family endonuclease